MGNMGASPKFLNKTVHLCNPSTNSTAYVDYSDPPLLSENPRADRGHKVLIIDENVDTNEVEASSHSWHHAHCPVCGCEHVNPKHAGTCSHNLTVMKSPGVACGDPAPSVEPGRKGFIPVAGVWPSTEYGGDWLTYAVGDCGGGENFYSRGKYTVAGLENHILYDEWPQKGASHVVSWVTNALVFKTLAGLPNGDHTVALTGSAEAKLIMFNHIDKRREVVLEPGNTSLECGIAEWRGAHLDASCAADAKIVCESGAAAVLTQKFNGSGGGVSVSHTARMELAAHDGYAAVFNDSDTYDDPAYGEGLKCNPSGIPPARRPPRTAAPGLKRRRAAMPLAKSN